MDCAREMRGTSSIAKAEIPQSRKIPTSSGTWWVGRNEMVEVPAVSLRTVEASRG